LQALEDRDGVAWTHLHDRLLPGARAPRGQAAPLGLGLDRGGAHLDDLDVEERLDRLADLRLVRVGMDAEGVLVVGGEHVAFLPHDGADDDLAVVHYSSASSLASAASAGSAFSPLARAVSSFSASSEISSEAAPTRPATPQSLEGSTETRRRVRKESATSAWSSLRTTSTEPPPAHSAINSWGFLVDGSSKGDGSRMAI